MALRKNKPPKIHIKKDHKKSLENLLKRKINKQDIITTDLASELAFFACEINNPVSLLIDRNGKIRDYYIGNLHHQDIKAQMAREKLITLSQLRIITANPKHTHPLDNDLLILRKYNLDILVYIYATKNGEYSQAQGESLAYADFAHICSIKNPPELWNISPKYTLNHIENNISFADLILSIEEDLAQENKSLTTNSIEKAILVGLGSEESFAELERLADTAGAQVVDIMTQNIKKADPKYYIGSGKINELNLYAEKHQADLIIFDGILTPSQVRNIETALYNKVKILDRPELILDIFAQRAKTREGKLQVELAQLEYIAPRLAGGYQALSKLGGGIGTRGPGETKLEVEKRKLNDRMAFLKNKVKEVQKTRLNQKKTRNNNKIPLVSLVGYTNAGKSTLFNVLTQSNILAEDKLFATLDPTIRKVHHNISDTTNSIDKPEIFEYLLSDTVGFIQNLPTTLIDAFKATLEEINTSDLLLIMLDASHPSRFDHLNIINTILKEIDVPEDKQRKLVFNQIDLLPESELTQLKRIYPDSLFISAQEKINLNSISDCVYQVFKIINN